MIDENTLTTLTDLYAVDALQGRREAIKSAVSRVIATRTAGTPLPGDWQGHVGPRLDGRLNFIPGPFERGNRVRAGANGSKTPARDRRRVIPL
jgi:hypothetical protein